MAPWDGQGMARRLGPRPGVVSEDAAPQLITTSTATLFPSANVSATRNAKIRRERLSITAQVGADSVEQTNDGDIEVPHLVGSLVPKAYLRLRRVHAEPGATPAEHRSD